MSPTTPFVQRRAASLRGTTPMRPSPYTPWRTGRTQRPEEHAGPESQALPGSADQITTQVEGQLRLAFLDAWQADVQSRKDPSTIQQSLATKLSLEVDSRIAQLEELLAQPSVHTLDRIELTSSLLSRMQFESSAWRLLVAAYGPTPPEPLPERPPCDLVGSLAGHPPIPAGGPSSRHPRLDHCRLILEWLEEGAKKELNKSGGPVLKPFNDPAYKWTESAKLSAARAIHMDKPLSGDGNLDIVESQAEERVTLALYRFIRAGQLEAAQDVCRRIGQHWRAASLGGAVATNGSDGVYASGRKHWRVVAKRIARGAAKNMTIWERAVYGALCGEVEPVLAVSTTFEDRVWARLSALVDSALNAHMDDDSFDGISRAGLQGTELDEIQVLDVFVAAASAAGAEDLYDLAKRMVVTLGLGSALDSKARLFAQSSLEHLATVPGEKVSPIEAWGLRFAAHIALFLDQAIPDEGSETKKTVLTNYCLYLSTLVRREAEIAVESNTASDRQIYALIARYTSSLGSKDQIKVFADVMKHALYADVSGAPQFASRQLWCLEEAGLCFEDRETLNELVTEAVDLIFKECLRDNSDHPRTLTTDEDLAVIGCLEYLNFPGYLYPRERIARINEAARRFTVDHRTVACQQLLDRITSEDAAALVTAGTESQGHEFRSWLLYREALKKHSTWESFFLTKRPTPPPEQVRQDSRAPPNEVSYEVQASANVQMLAYRELMQDYDGTCQQLRIDATCALMTALQSNWMRCPGDDDEHELATIRCIGVPTMVALLHSTLHKSACFVEAVQVADLVASATYNLCDDHSSEELQSLLVNIRDSSLCAMQEEIDQSSLQDPYPETFFEVCTKGSLSP